MQSNSTTNGHKSGFSVVIVGAGIAGLATATGLAQKGHKVTILEASPGLNEFGASIGILPNGVRVLKAFGLSDDFDSVVTRNKGVDVRDGMNEPLGFLAHNFANYAEIAYGTEIWNIHRADYQETLAKAAKACGAVIEFDAQIEEVNVEECRISLKDGREFSGDLIVGADGLRSIVRHSIPATSEVEPAALYEQCFRSTVPKRTMIGNPKLEWLLKNGNEMAWLEPGKYVLAWPLPENRPYDVICCVQRKSDVPPGKWGTRADPVAMAKDFEDFCPEVQELLKNIDGCVRWTLADLPTLKTCRSDNGKAVLVGDAFHGMVPHSASGGNSAIEDAAVLRECVDWAYQNSEPISRATTAFEAIRKERVERMQEASREGYVFLGADKDFKPIRDQALAEATQAQKLELEQPESERRAAPKAEADMHARFPTLPYLQWLYGYDAIAAAQDHLAKQERK